MDNQYGNDYNNQYGQQPNMMPQQPNMMNQQMNYNQYPNQMVFYGDNGNQQPSQGGRGGGIIGAIVVIVVIIGLVIFLLDYTGTINSKGNYVNNEEGINCQNFVCSYTSLGKSYTKTCEH